MVKKGKKSKDQETNKSKEKEEIVSEKEKPEDEEEVDLGKKELNVSKPEKAKSKKEGADNAPDQRTTGIDGSQLPSHNLPPPVDPKADVPPSHEEERKADVPEPAANEMSSSDDVKGGVSLDSSKPEVEWKVAATMPSILQLKSTPKLWNMYWTFSDKIDSFSDPISFHRMKLKLVNSIKVKYDYLLVGVESVPIEPSSITMNYRRITKPGALGFNLMQINEIELTAAQRNTNSDFLKVALGGDETSSHPEYERYKVWHQFVGLREEFNIIELAQQREHWNLIPIERILDYVQLWDVRDKMLKRPKKLPAESKLLRYPFHNLTACYEHLMERSQVIRRSMVSSIHAWIGSNIEISIPSEQGEKYVWQAFAKGIQLSTTTFSHISSFPNRLTYRSGADTARSLLTALAMGKWCEIEIPISLDILDLSTIIGCIMCKIMIPLHVMSERTVRMIDNYLFKYLIPLIPGITQHYRLMIGKMRVTNDTDVNYLSHMFANDGDVACNGNEDLWIHMRNFLHTLPTGSGWNFAGQKDDVSIPNSARMFINPTRWLRYSGYFGDASDTEDAQLEQFTRACSFLTAAQFSRGSKTAGDVAKILEVALLQGGEVRAKSMRIYMNYVLNRLGLLAIAGPLTPGSREYYEHQYERVRRSRGELGYRVPLSISIDGIASMVWNVDWDHYKPRNGFDLQLFETGLSIINYFTDLTTSYHYINDHFKATDSTPELRKYTSTDRYKMMLEHLKIRVPLSSVIEELIGSKPWLYDLKDHMPPKEMIGYERLPDVLLLKEAEKLVDAYPHYFGYVPRFYMTHRGSEGVYETDSRLYAVNYRVRPDAKVVRSVSFQELVEALTSANGFVELTKDLKIDELIEFDFPVMFEDKAVAEDIEATDVNVVPFKLDNLGLSMSDLIQRIRIVYRLKDDLVNVSSNGAGLRWTPIFAVRETLPFLPQDEIPFPSLLHKIETWRSETIRIWKDFEFISA